MIKGGTTSGYYCLFVCFANDISYPDFSDLYGSFIFMLLFQSGETHPERKEHLFTCSCKYEKCQKSLVIRPHHDVTHSRGLVKT